MPGCKLFNYHKHLKLGLLLFQLIYGPYQDFYDLNLLQNTYQRTSHNFLFIFNHSKCDMMLVVLLKFTGVSTTGYLLTQYFYVVTSVCYVHPWSFWQRKTGKLFNVGLKLNLNSKLPRADYTHIYSYKKIDTSHFLPNQIFNLFLSYYFHFQYNKYVRKSFKLDA